MSESIVATLTVSYDSDIIKNQWNNGDGLVLERHSGFTGLKRGIPFRQYPPCPSKLVCSYGIISDIPEYRTSEEKEVVAFSGSDKVSLKRGLASSVVYSLVGEWAIDEKGNSVYPKISYDYVNNQLVSDKKFYGAVNVTYQAPYSLYFYEFTTQIDPVSGGVTLFGHDTIHAFYKKNHAELDMEMSFKMQEQWMPFYTVYTKIVLDELGVWEYPKNWESVDNANYSKKQDDPSREKRDDGTFPGWSNHKIPTDASFTDERVHQIGEFDFIGRLKTSTPNDILGVQDPYWGSTNMSFSGLAAAGLIQFRLKFAPKPTWKRSMLYPEQNLFRAYFSIDKDEIYAELLYDYPNLKREGS